MFSEKAKSKAELREIAEKLLLQFKDERIFALYGKMGAGKTTFIQTICRSLGSVDNITSPTFAIINEYRTSENEPIFHFDFYRIKNIGEAYDLGYEDYFYSNNFCFIEWPERIEELLPDKIIKVYLEVEEDETRIITAKKD